MTKVEGRTEKERLFLAGSVGTLLNKGPSEKEDRQVIEDLARLLAADASAAVRQALATEIRFCLHLPKELAEKIARDIDDVAMPFVEQSPVLSDEFLAELVAECSEMVRVSVAGRPQVCEPLGFTLSQHGGKPSIARLLENDGAEGSSRIFLQVMNRFDDSGAIMDRLAARSDLTLIIIDKLTEKLSNEAGNKLVSDYGLAPDLADYIQALAQRSALQDALGKASGEQIDAYLQNIHKKGHINPGLLLHFLDEGAFYLFEKGLALCADVPVENIEPLIDGAGAKGLEALMRKADFKEEIRPLLKAGFLENLESIRAYWRNE